MMHTANPTKIREAIELLRRARDVLHKAGAPKAAAAAYKAMRSADSAMRYAEQRTAKEHDEPGQVRNPEERIQHDGMLGDPIPPLESAGARPGIGGFV